MIDVRKVETHASVLLPRVFLDLSFMQVSAVYAYYLLGVIYYVHLRGEFSTLEPESEFLDREVYGTVSGRECDCN